MTSRTTRRFRQLLALLSPQTRRQAREAYQLFEQNPHHPSLHFKKVHATRPIFSARVNQDVRAVGLLHEDVITWFWIGAHDDYERLLKSI
jgi:hypothetical protein